MMFPGTPGLTTTRSSWSNSQLGGSPGNNPIPTSFNATASGDHFSIGFWSLSATVAPWSTRNLAAAIPLRAAPIIKTLRPVNSTNPKNAAGVYRSFNVDKLNNANRIASIKNRNTIFDSFQSCISKW